MTLAEEGEKVINAGVIAPLHSIISDRSPISCGRRPRIHGWAYAPATFVHRPEVFAMSWSEPVCMNRRGLSLVKIAESTKAFHDTWAWVMSSASPPKTPQGETATPSVIISFPSQHNGFPTHAEVWSPTQYWWGVLVNALSKRLHGLISLGILSPVYFQILQG